MRRTSLIALIVAACLCGQAAGGVIINFDDRAGKPPPFGPGEPVAPQYIVDDEYAALGVLFSSAGGGIAIVAPSNPVSAPNAANATGPGPVISFSNPVNATFQIGPTPAIVDTVSITLSNSSSTSFLDAFNLGGTLLGTSSGGASATLTVTFPAQIHSIRIRQGPMAFDNFTFDGLAAVPEPGGTIAIVALCGMIRRRRR